MPDEVSAPCRALYYAVQIQTGPPFDEDILSVERLACAQTVQSADNPGSNWSVGSTQENISSFHAHTTRIYGFQLPSPFKA